MALTFGKTSFAVQRGLTWSESITVLQGAIGPPVDLTGKACLMQIRRKLPDADVVMELNAANGRLVVSDAALGKIMLLVSAEDTLLLPLSAYRKSLYVYDALLLSGSGLSQVREPIISGKVAVKHTVSRPWT